MVCARSSRTTALPDKSIFSQFKDQKFLCNYSNAHFDLTDFFELLDMHWKSPIYSGLSHLTNFLLTGESQFFWYCWSGIVAWTISYRFYWTFFELGTYLLQLCNKLLNLNFAKYFDLSISLRRGLYHLVVMPWIVNFFRFSNCTYFLAINDCNFGYFYQFMISF